MRIYSIVVLVFLCYFGTLILDFFKAEWVSESEVSYLLIIIFEFVGESYVEGPAVV